MSSENVNAIRLRGELCSLTDIVGVRSLRTQGGLDLVTVSEGLHEQLVKFTKILGDVSERVSALENKLSKGDVGASADVVARLSALEKAASDGSLRGPPGPPGADGVDGRDGLRGPAGERGPRGVVEKLQDVKDVDLSGLSDGAILVYRKNKWVVEIPEE